ncbi:hypothetical protein PIB30_027040 [Stylosanthes scabra]|uniref:Uncharacterized protein n=1 Tax=Stylosanthes scabra TaxID=79078 RepID=A0ABU6RAT1_9FABA|nr:hypothetical protein [Stylosanthes scabra]
MGQARLFYNPTQYQQPSPSYSNISMDEKIQLYLQKQEAHQREQKEYQEELRNTLQKSDDDMCINHEEVVECKTEVEMTSEINIEEASEMKHDIEDLVAPSSLQVHDPIWEESVHPPMGITYDEEETLEEKHEMEVEVQTCKVLEMGNRESKGWSANYLTSSVGILSH